MDRGRSLLQLTTLIGGKCIPRENRITMAVDEDRSLRKSGSDAEVR